MTTLKLRKYRANSLGAKYAHEVFSLRESGWTFEKIAEVISYLEDRSAHPISSKAVSKLYYELKEGAENE